MTRACSIAGCGNVRRARGLCSTHWNRWRRHGDPNKTIHIQGDDTARFLSHVTSSSDSGCWEWTGSRNWCGYGGFKTTSSHTGAHRWSYEKWIGPIEDGLTIDHLCRNRACVNPAHMEQVTMRENVLRGDTFAARNHNKTHCIAGHEFSAGNTYRRKSRPNQRQCRECNRLRMEKIRRLRRAS